jgi:hypothetical protein
MTPAAIVALTLISGCVSWAAPVCPTSPSYSPDFTSNQSCMTLLGNGIGIPQINASFQSGLLQITPNSPQQRGYAWYNTPQPVGSSFSTTFTFQLTGTGNPPADGFAFVIQNSSGGANTVGPTGSDGCGLGFGDDPSGDGNACVNAAGGITNSVAVGFKTFNSGTGLPYPDSVFIASNGTGPNCVDVMGDVIPETTTPVSCVIAENDLSGADSSPNSFDCEGSGICLADGNVHTVTITYALQPTAAQSACYAPVTNAPLPCLDVVLDGTDLFPTGVAFNMTSIGLTNNTAYAGFTGATGGSVENNDILSWTFTPQSFGDINVCPSGQNGPAPCSNTIPVTFSVPAGTTINSVNPVSVLTQGVSGLDFSLASSGTCTGTYVTAGVCTANITFTPRAPGLRQGAVELFGSAVTPAVTPLFGSGAPLATTLIYGIGQGPAIAFSPGTQTMVGSGLTSPYSIAEDAAGNFYIATWTNGSVVKISGDMQTTLLNEGGDTLEGVAVDGAGNVYTADQSSGKVLEIPAGGGTPITLVTGLNNPSGVAVDGTGNVFIAGYQDNQVIELPAGGGPQITVGSGLNAPQGVAVDGLGDVFIADSGNNRVVEVTANGMQTPLPFTGLDNSDPIGVAVDGAGDVFVANYSGANVLERTPGGTQTTVVTAGEFGYPLVSVAVDAAGDIFIPELGNNQIVEIQGSQPPSLSFTAETVGITPVDSPQTVQVQNVGNADLTLSSISFPMDFPQVGDENDCLAQSSLIPGQTCPLTIEFDPTVGGAPPNGTPLIEAVGLTDNALNASPGATQSILVEGNGLSPEVNVPNLVGQTESGASSLLTAMGVGLDLGTVTMQTSSIVPIGEVISQVPTAGAQVLVGSSVSVAISSGVPVPSVVGQTEANAEGSITGAGLNVGTVTTQYSDTVSSGNVISQSPTSPPNVNGGTSVNLVVSNGVPPAADQLTLENNYFVTGDYASAGATPLIGSPTGTGTITIPDPSPCAPPNCGPGVPDGADIIDGFLYWTTVETSASPSGSAGTFLGYSIIGQQIGSDVPNYSDGTNTGTLRVYRADVNTYFQVPSNWNGARLGSGTFTVTLPNGGGAITEGASLVVIYRVLSPLFPLKSVVIYDGSIVPAALNAGPIPQAVQGFYDSALLPNVTGENTILSTSGGSWNNSSGPVALPVHSNQYIETLTPGNQTPGTGTGNAYAAIIFSTPVSNMNSDGILDAWKTAQGYTDVKTGEWVPLPGATLGEQDLFVQFDYMCSALTSYNVCDFTKPNLYPSPDAQGNDPLAMVTQAYANIGIHLHLVPGNAILETTCTDNPPQLCLFPNEPGVVAWDSSVQLAKVLPANYSACTGNPTPANCAPSFPYGQKDSYHYVLFGYSVAIPSWTTRSGSITSITVSGATANSGGSGSIVTKGLGTTCPTRITVAGVQGNPNLNGIYDKNYNNLTCDSGLTTIYFSTPVGVPNWSYSSTISNGLAEPAISVTSGTVTTMSGFSDLGGSDSVVSLGAWATAPAQDMSKSATVVAGTLFHEIGHTLGLTHGGLYFDTPGSYVPTFEANCKPNFQSTMNYLFQIDGLGPNAAIAYSNQALYGEPQAVPGVLTTPLILAGDSTTANPNFTTIPFGSVVDLTDAFGNRATFSSSSWYTPTAPSTTASPATMHCDGTPLTGDTGYRVNGPVDAISPAWGPYQNITFDGAQYSDLRGYDDVTSFDLRQVGAASGELAALANEISYRTTGVFYGGSGGLSIGGSGGLSIGGSGGLSIGGSGGLSIGGSGGLSIGGSGGLSIGGSGGLSIGGSGGLSIGGSGGLSIGGSGGVPTEVDYLTVNSIVRPPNSPTLTPVMTNGVVTSVTVDWTAPAFGVVQYYTVYRGCNPNGSDAVNIGVVNGVGGAAPATEFIDSNPVTCSGSSGVIYTIATTLNPVQIDQTQRSSAPSVPAIIKNHQTIVLGPIQSSVTYSTPPPTVMVTATAETNGSPNGLQVNFVATGPCSVTVLSVSTATVSVNNPGSNPATCIVTASQPGTNPTASSMPPYYDAANSVSESFTIEPAGSNVLPQTISWTTLSNVQYGGTFSLSATAESNGMPDGLPVTFKASGPCTTAGTTTGVGPCTITATAPAGTVGSNSYSVASVTQSFTITPAVLTVTATSFPSVPYGTPIPALTYSVTGFEPGDSAASVLGSTAPALSTTASQGSSPGGYPITISTGSLAAANYSFYFVNGTLTIVPAPLLTVTPSAISFGSVTLGSITTKNITVTNNGTAPVTITQPLLSIVHGGNSNEFVAVSLCPASLAVGKSCTITIAFVAGPYYTPQSATLEIMDNAPGNPQPVILSALVLQPQTITFNPNNPPATAAYNSTFTAIATGGGSGNAVTFTGSGVCSITGTTPGTATYKMTSGTGTCSVIANQAGNSTYAAAAQVTKTVTATLAPQTITFNTSPPTSASYKTSFTVAATASSTLAVTYTSSGVCSNSGATYTMTSGTGTCKVIVSQAGNTNYAAAPQITTTVTAVYSKASLTPTAGLSFGPVSNKSSASLPLTLTNTGTTPLIISGIAITGTNASNFSQTNNCPAASSSLAPTKTCTITVTFNSSGKGASASITVTDNTQTATQTVSLSGS